MRHPTDVPIARGAIAGEPRIRLAVSEPMPTLNRSRRGKLDNLRRGLLALCPGEQLPFYADYFEQAYRAAKQLGIKIRTRKDEYGRGIAVWRVT